MPELPEVETTRLGIRPYLLNQTISSITVREMRLRQLVPVSLPELCAHQKIIDVTRRGKYILIHLETGVILIHLGMSGHLRFVKEEISPLKHDHIDLRLTNALILRYQDPRRFGLWLFISGEINAHPLLSKLGPEPLSDEFNADYLFKRAHHRKQSIKTFIMNSHIVVGVGNIYASESLFCAHIHPQTPAGFIARTECEGLVLHIKRVLEQSIKAGGTTLRDFFASDGKPGHFANQLMVYGRNNRLCHQCSTPIQSLVLTGRNTYFCPTCQPRVGKT